MNTTIEKNSLDQEEVLTSIADYPLHNKLKKMDNMAFIAWLESEAV